MTITDHCVVSLQYTLTNPEGETLDQSKPGEPLVYLHGASNLIPGVEKALTGKSVGDEFSIVVAPEEGYGVRDEKLRQKLPMSEFEGFMDIEPGVEFRVDDDDGNVEYFTIVEVNGDEVTVDGNHELAGITLHFDIRIESIRKATPEEIAHGHVHGPGHCH